MSVRLPKHVVHAAIIGSSRDARIVRCFDGSQTYWARTKAGEVALPGLRRVENFLPDIDFTLWTPNAGGTGSSPVVTFLRYEVIDGILLPVYRLQASLNGGASSSDYSYLLRSISYYGDLWKTFYARASTTQKIHVDYGTSKVLTVDRQWRRFALLRGWSSQYQNLNIGTRGAYGSDDTIDIEVAGPCFCADRLTLPFEFVDPGRDYGFGAPGVRYFDYENPFSVDANGVVTDTGARVPISGGGLLLAPAETENIKNNCFTEPGAGGGDVFADWTESVAGSSTISQETSDLPAGFEAACRFDVDASDSSVLVDQSLFATGYAAGDELWLSMLVKSQNASGLYVVLDVDDGAGGNQQWLSGDTTNGATWSTTTAQFNILDLPSAWGLWTFRLPPLPTGVSRVRSLSIRRQNLASKYAIFTNVQLTKTLPHNVRIKTITAPASRIADSGPLKWRSRRRLRCRLHLDTRYFVPEGVLLGADVGGIPRTLVEILDDGRVRVTDPSGEMVTSTATVPPGTPDARVSVDAGPTGVTLMIDMTDENFPKTMDFSTVGELYLAHRPDGLHSGALVNIMLDFF